MPRIDFKLWDRVYILKLICTAQMTYSSFITLVYFYLIILQSWTCWESKRPDVLKFKWSVIGVSILEFGLGTLLAFAANMMCDIRLKSHFQWHYSYCITAVLALSNLDQISLRESTKTFVGRGAITPKRSSLSRGITVRDKEQKLTETGIRCRQQIIVWLVLETLLVPVSICLLMQLYYKIVRSTLKYTTDPHYARVNIAQVCFLLCQYIFIGYALDFLVHTERKPKMYDPSIRPESVYAPTDPQITTTESRHIRMSQSFLSQPSSSKKVTVSEFNDVGSSSSSSETKITPEEAEIRNSKEWDRETE